MFCDINSKVLRFFFTCLRLLSQILAGNISPNIISYNSAINACASAAASAAREADFQGKGHQPSDVISWLESCYTDVKVSCCIPGVCEF